MRFLELIITGVFERLAWVCVMLSLAVVGLISPQTLIRWMGEFEDNEKQLVK